MAECYVILGDGQSNMAGDRAYSGTLRWPLNLYRWNWPAADPQNDTGDTWEAPGTSTASLLDWYGYYVARAMPGTNVCIINIARGSQPIAQWLPTPTTGGDPVLYDMWDIRGNVVPVALAALQSQGLAHYAVTHVDEEAWMQGESDSTSPASHATNLETVHTQRLALSYFRRTTPLRIMGIAGVSITNLPGRSYINDQLKRFVAADLDNRIFVNTESLPVGNWTDTNNLHLTGDGYPLAAEMLFNAAWRGSRRVHTRFGGVTRIV